MKMRYEPEFTAGYTALFPLNYFQFTREGNFSNCVVSSNLLLQKKPPVEFHSRGQNFWKNFYDTNYQISKDQFFTYESQPLLVLGLREGFK